MPSRRLWTSTSKSQLLIPLCCKSRLPAKLGCNWVCNTPRMTETTIAATIRFPEDTTYAECSTYEPADDPGFGRIWMFSPAESWICLFLAFYLLNNKPVWSVWQKNHLKKWTWAFVASAVRDIDDPDKMEQWKRHFNITLEIHRPGCIPWNWINIV